MTNNSYFRYYTRTTGPAGYAFILSYMIHRQMISHLNISRLQIATPFKTQTETISSHSAITSSKIKSNQIKSTQLNRTNSNRFQPITPHLLKQPNPTQPNPVTSLTQLLQHLYPTLSKPNVRPVLTRTILIQKQWGASNCPPSCDC